MQHETRGARGTRRTAGRRAGALIAILAAQLASGPAWAAQSASADRSVWITLSTRDVAALQQSSPEDDWADALQTYETHEGVTVALVPEARLASLSRAMHARARKCGGFMAHPSREAALDALYFRPDYAAPAPDISYTIDNGAVAQALIDQVQASNIVSTINLLASNTNRYYTQSGGVNAANQIKARWEGYATGRSDVTVELFTHPTWAMPSVIATINGTTLPSEVIVIGGHLDSINSSSPTTGTAPGADDDASGVAALTEAFRAAMATGFRPQRTLKFMAYAAEEVGLRGSAEIATNYQTAGVNVVGVLQLDMTNFKGSTPDIVLITDNTNAAQNTFVGSLVDTYLPTLTRSTTACGYACSDHASWHSRGYVASFPFEALMGQHNSRIHTVNDTLANSDSTGGHAAKFARLTAAYMAELAKGTLGSSDTTPPTTSITAPAAGSTVSGTVTISANASDNVGVARVDFLVDSVVVGNDTSSPYAFAWNSAGVANGAHTLTTKAYDAAGNVGTSAGVGVTVSNTASPVTVTFTSIGAEDGRTWESTETSNVGGGATASDTSTSGLRVGDLTTDRSYRSVLSFDTSSIPDTATITAASLRLVRGTISGTNPFTLLGTCQVDVRTGFFGTAATLANADFEAAATTAAVASLSNPTANGSASTGTLNAAGLLAISKTGKTQFKIFFTTDDNDNNAYDYIGFYGGEAATAANRPTLTITYQP
jgi:leucyl aminopeptidase